jgi:hypothetical protein
MAKVIHNDTDSRIIPQPFKWLRNLIIGLLLGVAFWSLTGLAYFYTGSISVAGDISTILTATVGILIMVSVRMTRPLIVAVSSAISLWGLAGWTDGLDKIEVMGWSVLLYAVTYCLYLWIVRFARLVPVLILVMAIVLLTRIISA